MGFQQTSTARTRDGDIPQTETGPAGGQPGMQGVQYMAEIEQTQIQRSYEVCPCQAGRCGALQIRVPTVQDAG